MTSSDNTAEFTQRARRRRAGWAVDKPTVEDIARAAGVSTATVSRTLNKPDSVSEELRDKVAAKVRELGYMPSGAARALASNRSFTVGAVIPTLNNAIFAASVAAFEETLSANGYTLLVTVFNYDQLHEVEQIRRLLERGVDALMLVGLNHDEDIWPLLERSGCPTVAIWGHSKNPPVPCLGFDNAGASGVAVNHLIELGHSRIGMIAGISAGNDRAAARREGVEQTLRDHGLPVDPDIFVEKPYSHPDGREGFWQLMNRSDPPTAIVCGNDVLAMGAMFEAADHGMKVPDDISVIGFDNLPITEHLRPALTTINVPSVEIGRAAAEAVVEHLATGAPILSRSFPAPFLLRSTTRAVR